jgi:hypothetical protein
MTKRSNGPQQVGDLLSRLREGGDVRQLAQRVHAAGIYS